MQTDKLIGIIIVAIVNIVLILPLYVFMIYVCTGRGGKFLLFYHFEPKSKEAMKYHKQIMLRFGLMAIVMLALTQAGLISGILWDAIAFAIFLPLVFVVEAIGIIYFSLSKKMKKLFELERIKYDEDEMP